MIVDIFAVILTALLIGVIVGPFAIAIWAVFRK